jgi:hypothetical protein
MNRLVPIGVAITSLFLVKTGHAAAVTFEFEGVVDRVGKDCTATIGDVFSGSYTFDSAATNTSVEPLVGTYDSIGPQYGARGDVNGHTVTNYGRLHIAVWVLPPPDGNRYQVSTLKGPEQIGFTFKTNLPDTSLPLIPPPIVVPENASVGGCIGHLTQLVARPQGNGLYDSFSSSLIDPELWRNSRPCQHSDNTLECVRELRGNKLHMRIRSYGATDSNQGTPFDFTELAFRHPEPITTIVSNIIVTEAGAVGCTENPQASHTHVRIDGTFFNTGSGDEADDVTAFIVADRDQTAPVIDVGAFLHTAGAFLGNASLGTIAVGEKVQLTLRWNPDADRFVFRLERDNQPPSVATIPYTFSDTTPPTIKSKKLGVHAFPASCTNNASVASMQADFLNVRVNQGALP